MSDRTKDERTQFDAWFRQWQQRTWSASRIPSDPTEPSQTWGSAYKSRMLEAWMARAAVSAEPKP